MSASPTEQAIRELVAYMDATHTTLLMQVLPRDPGARLSVVRQRAIGWCFALRDYGPDGIDHSRVELARKGWTP